ncbi:hypothetical protein DFJ77DRAFT_518089 [Powellomyces hirtus]|nr:hypothetical protein DFJ77DRAFT_518089 [Powellomyces hirtus]
MTVSSTPTTFFEGEPYHIEDAADSLTVSLYVPDSFDPNAQPADVVDIQKDRLRVHVRGEPTDRLKGWLFAAIDERQSLYQLHRDAKTGFRVLSLHLVKVARNELEGMPAFPLLFSSGFDTPAPLPKTASLEDMDAHSVYLLGDFLLVRLRAAQRALDMYERAAQRGSIKACLKLAAWYHIGKEAQSAIPVSRDAKKALEYHIQAADLGHAEACLHVSYSFVPPTESPDADETKGVPSVTTTSPTPKDYVQAIRYCDKVRDICDAHKLGTSDLARMALWRAGNLLRDGANEASTTPANVTRAFEAFDTLATTWNDPLAMWTVAIYHIWGFGTPQNVEKGVALLRTARAADPALGMPPGLQGLNDDDVALDILIQVEAQARKSTESTDPGKILDVEGLVRVTRQIITQAGGSEHVQETIQAALAQVAAVKVHTIGAGAAVAKPIEATTTTTAAAKKKGRKSKRAKTLSPTVELAMGATVLAAVGLAAWMWVKTRRAHA